MNFYDSQKTKCHIPAIGLTCCNSAFEMNNMPKGSSYPWIKENPCYRIWSRLNGESDEKINPEEPLNYKKKSWKEIRTNRNKNARDSAAQALQNGAQKVHLIYINTEYSNGIAWCEAISKIEITE